MSLCLKLALIGVAVCLLKKADSQRPDGIMAPTPKVLSWPGRTSLPATSTAPALATFVTNRFEWGKIESEDFEQLAANLRAIGCPEKTVRDVAGARARRELERLSRSAAPIVAFWTAGLQRAQARRKAEDAGAAARVKLLASVERALGRDAFIENGRLMEDFVEQAIVRFVSGPMPEETFSRLAALLDRQEAQRDAIRARTRGVWLDEDEAALNTLGLRSRQQLAAALHPAELEEFSARLAMVKLVDQVLFEAMDLSPAEIRTVASIRSQFDDPAPSDWFKGDSLTDEQEVQFSKALRGCLGERRYAQFERAGDGDFKTLFELGRQQNLPREAAVTVFELRKVTAQEVEQVRQDSSLSDTDRQQRLAETQNLAQEGVLQVLGAEACAQYLGRGGEWLTNVNKL